MAASEEVGEDDSIEILNDSMEDVKEEKQKEEEDDIWDNMVVIDHKKKRKTKDHDVAKSKRLKWYQ